MNILRTAKAQNHYEKVLRDNTGHRLWNLPPIKSFKYFYIVENEFPHDRIAIEHHLLLPKRRITDWRKLRWYEWREFKKLHDILAPDYDCIKLNYPSYITVKEIVHWHLYVLKDKR